MRCRTPSKRTSRRTGHPNPRSARSRPGGCSSPTMSACSRRRATSRHAARCSAARTWPAPRLSCPCWVPRTPARILLLRSTERPTASRSPSCSRTSSAGTRKWSGTVTRNCCRERIWPPDSSNWPRTADCREASARSARPRPTSPRSPLTPPHSGRASTIRACSTNPPRGCYTNEPSAFRRKILYAEDLIRQSFFLRFGQPPARGEADDVGRSADESRRIREPDGRRGAGHGRYEARRHQGGGRPEHAAADVGRKALARSPQVRRIHARQIVPPETELRDREEAKRRDAPFEERHVRGGRVQKDDGHQDQTRNLKNVQQPAAADKVHGEEGQRDAAGQTAELLERLDLADGLLDRRARHRPHGRQPRHDARHLLNCSERRRIP